MSHVPFYGPPDDFGVLPNTLGCSEEVFRALGRVAALGALIELKMSGIVTGYGLDESDRGQRMGHLVQRVEEIMVTFESAGLEIPEGLMEAVRVAEAVMAERHHLIHSMRPGDDSAWLDRPGASLKTADVQGMRDIILRLQDAMYSLMSHVRSPAIFPPPPAEAECVCGCGKPTTHTWLRGHRATAIQKRIDRDFGGDAVAFLRRLDELSDARPDQVGPDSAATS